MQINSSYDSKEFNDFYMTLSRSRTKLCSLRDNEGQFSEYEESVDPSNFRLNYHVKRVKAAIPMKKRDYKILSNSYQDTHGEVEKIGCYVYFKEYVVLISLENRLDLVLQKCCGANPDKIRAMTNYDYISFKTLTGDVKKADGITINQHRGWDRNYDDFIRSCFYANGLEGTQLTYEEIMRNFYAKVWDASTSILTSVVMKLYKPFRLSLRSQGFADFVLGVMGDVKDIPDYAEYDDGLNVYKLPLHKLRKKEYFHRLKDGEIF